MGTLCTGAAPPVGDPYAPKLVGLAGVIIDGGGAVPSTGSKHYRRVNYAGTITGWTILTDQTGSAQITIKKCTYAGFPTTASIVASAPVVLTSARKNQSTTLTGWTLNFAAGDIFEFNLDSVSGCQWIELDIDTVRT